MLLSFIAQLAVSQQWVTFITRPENVILTVDETRIVVRDGCVRLLLAPGPHKYSAESPYFEPLADTFDLNDTARSDIFVVMQSAYSYIDVNTHFNNADIYIDCRNIGKDKLVSCRMTAGDHRLTIIDDTLCLFDGKIVLQRAEKKHVDISLLNVTPFRWDAARWLIPLSAMTEDGILSDSTLMDEAHAEMELGECGVNVTCNIAGADIYIDGKFAGTAPLVIHGLVANRKYLVTLQKKGYKNVSAIFSAESDNVVEVKLKMKKKI